LAIFARFLLFLAFFDPPTSKMYLFHHIKCKNAAESEKNRQRAYLKFWVAERLQNSKLQIFAQKWPLRVKIGPNAPNGI